ncbi:MAG: hypothetical protein ABJA35_06505 [Parafilimonas sp.]
MQENEFEKQLKKAMENFRLSPSASVWEKVKKKLDEKKRRIMPFFFLLIAGLITAGYFIYHVSEQHQQNSIKNVTGNNTEIPKTYLQDSNKTSAQKNIVKQNIHDTSLNTKQKYLNYNLDLYNKEKVVKQTNTDVVINEKAEADKKNIQTRKNTFKEQVSIHNPKENIDFNALNNTPAQESSAATQPSEIFHDSSAVKQNINEDSIKKIASANADSISTTGNILPNIAKHIEKKPGKTYKNPNWKFGITASYGRSKLIEKANESNNFAPQYLNSGTGNNASPNATIHNAHPFSSSNAYSFGAVVQKKILKNTYISTGLTFTHLSVSSNVNNKIDSSLIIQTSNNISSFYAVNGYYQAGSSKVYNSRYNFIEIPVSFQQYIFHSKQTSLSYNAGVSVRELISSNALIYNPNNNIYFSKDDFFKKTQFQVLAGLNVEINTGKNSSVFIGPQFKYSFSNLAKNKNIGSFHFINYGLQAGFLLHKK